MQIICSYCHKDLGEKEPLEDQGLSHGMCPECTDHFLAQIDGLPLGEYLDNFKFPVVIINSDSRIIATNKAAEKLTGRSSDRVRGLLGGEAMECVYARLSEGCGNTVHCETCTIRRAVMSVMETGKAKDHVPVKLKQEEHEISMIISVKKIDNFVRMVVEATQVLPSG